MKNINKHNAMTRIIRTVFFALTLIFVVQSCSNKLDLTPEDERLLGDAAFEDPSSYQAFLAKIYAGISLSGNKVLLVILTLPDWMKDFQIT